jgi:hypothetical protein
MFNSTRKIVSTNGPSDTIVDSIENAKKKEIPGKR